LKGIGLKDSITVNSREFQVNTGNDPQKNLVKSEVYEQGKYLFCVEEVYSIRENDPNIIDLEYVKDVTFNHHQSIIEEIKLLFVINEKLKQIRQPLPHFRLGKVFLARGFTEEAVNNFARAVELNPQFINGYIKLGMAYFKHGLFEQAVKTFLQAHKLGPNFPDIINCLGVVYSKTGNFPSASKFLNRALEIKPNYKEASFNLGIVLFLSTISDYAENEKVVIPARFIRSFKAIVQEEKYRTRMWHERFLNAKKVLDEGKRQNVIDVLEKLQADILFNTDNSEIMDFFFLQFMYGGKEINNTQLEMFEELINEEVEKHSQYADYWNELGIIHLIQCREYFLKSIAEFEKSHKLDPDYKSAQKNSDLLKHNKQGFLILLRAILK
jgi:Flp pilus assembly protein TadD